MIDAMLNCDACFDIDANADVTCEQGINQIQIQNVVIVTFLQ